ncbi:MAG: mechanosensitive ion channel family protein [Elainellaceae cyanobacterium]
MTLFVLAIATTVVTSLLPLNMTSWTSGAVAQENPPAEQTSATASPEAPTEKASPLNIDLPPEINNLLTTDWIEGVTQQTVWLDGHPIIRVTGQVWGSGSEVGGDLSAKRRAQIVERRLRSVVSSNLDPDSLDVFPDEGNDQFVIKVTYTANGDTQTDPIVTVNSLDARVNQVASREILAQQWEETIEEALIRAYEERQPEFLQQQTKYAGAILFVMALLSLIVAYFLSRLKKEQETLAAIADQHAQQLSAARDGSGTSQPSMTALLVKQQLADQQQRSFNELKRRILQLGQIAIWGSGTYFILGLFPYSRWLQPIILNLIKIPGKIFLIITGTYLVIRFGSVLIDRFFWVLQSSSHFSPEKSQRRALRFSTFATVTKGVLGFLAGLVAFVIALSSVGVNVAPLLAGAGILGLAVSFAAQNLIKDVINGFLILVEDQYGVGDVVIFGDVGGFVEYMGLRITQLRNEEGRLITVPNGSITVVQNLTKEWSRVDLLIDVDHSADIDKAIAVIERVATEMTKDDKWKHLILEPPLLLGVDQLNYVGATVRMWIKTQPLKQWDIAREYRRRLKIAFDQAGISIGIPQQSLRFNTSLGIQRPTAHGNGYSHLNYDASAEDGHETPSRP